MLMSFSYHQRSYTVPILLLSTMQSSHTWVHKILNKISNIIYWMLLLALILFFSLPPWKICLLLCLSPHVLQKSASWCDGCHWVSQGVPVHSREKKYAIINELWNQSLLIFCKTVHQVTLEASATNERKKVFLTQLIGGNFGQSCKQDTLVSLVSTSVTVRVITAYNNIHAGTVLSMG